MRQVLNDDQWIQVIFNLTRALEDLHMVGIIHNDIKPDNVLVEITGSGGVKVAILDLGLARHTGTVYGAPDNPDKYPWMGPEILNRGLCTSASDLYGLGYIIQEIQQVLHSHTPWLVLEAHVSFC